MSADRAVGVDRTRKATLAALSLAITGTVALAVFESYEGRRHSETPALLRRSNQTVTISHSLHAAELAGLELPGPGARTLALAGLGAVLGLIILAALLIRRSESNSRWAVAELRAENQQALARLELYRAALYGIGEGVITTNNSGRIQMMNGVAERMIGLAETCAAGRPVEDVFRIVDEDSRAVLASPVREILRTGRTTALANRAVLLSYTGAEVPVDHCGSPVRGGDGTLMGTVLVFRDVTERRRALERSRRLAAIVEDSQDAIVSKTLDGIVTTWNPGAEMIFGYTAEEMIGCRISKLIPPERADEMALILSRIRNGERVDHFETERITKDGRLITVSLTVSPILDDEGRIVGASKIARDMAAQRQLEERLRQSQKMEAVGLLAGGIAHDFNNLLTVINGYADLLEREIALNRVARQQLMQIRTAGEHAAALTRHLLAFSRKQVLQAKTLDLNSWVAGAKSLLERLIREEIQVVTDFGTGVAPVEVDPNQLEQVLMNLVINATDAIVGPGTITIRTSAAVLDAGQARVRADAAAGEYAVLEVHDTGMGMEPAVVTRIYEPFFTTKAVKGTGLGLSIVFGIVKQSRGFVELESEPRRGTSFRVYLPGSRKPVEATPGLSASQPGYGNETVLLAEDDARLREYAAVVLRGLGYQVIAVGDGSQAVETVRNSALSFDLLVTDVIMPKMSGPAAAEVIRTLSPATRVLYMSGYADDNVSREVDLTPGVNLLHKPFAPEELARQVRRVLNERREAAGAA